MTAIRPGLDYFDILSGGLEETTWRRSGRLGLANAEQNLPFITSTIKELAGRAEGRTCLVVSGGPSLARRASLERLRPVMDKFVIVAADGALGHCLRADIVPDYVLSVDPHPDRIVRWFGDVDLTEKKLADDYYRRQDLDSHFNADEIERNRDQLGLVDAAGPAITAVLGTSAPEAVRNRCLASGMAVHWWNPIYDDISDANSVTRQLHRKNGVPCMNAGGNVGTAAVIFAARILRARRVVMVGMDFSYHADTPIENTQYYGQLTAFMNAAELPGAFKTVRNPYLDEDYYTDPAYYWYRQAFSELMAGFGGCEIVNATEGGILFGGGIVWATVREVIDTMSNEEISS